jgi:RHS repeat-associated protein
VLYAPFGEVITEHNAYWHNGLLPDYMFNAKELDEESGMYYYEARYYNPPIFISRDPMFEVRPYMSPYAYCSNSPINRIDPTGMLDGDFYDWNGKYLGWDGKTDDNVHFVSDRKSVKTIKANEKANATTNAESVKVDVTTTKAVINDILDVDSRTATNGETREEATFHTTAGRYTGQGSDINTIPYDQTASASVTYEGDIEVSIHSHLPIRYNPKNRNEVKTASALRPSGTDKGIQSNLNIITGSLGDADWISSSTGGSWSIPERGAAFYGSNWQLKGSISIKNLRKTTTPR